jgi:hypothetical protein
MGGTLGKQRGQFSGNANGFFGSKHGSGLNGLSV